MLSKKQKTIMAILGSVGILFGLIVAIPFRSFPGLNKIENILTIELIIKLVLGVLSILLAVYPLIKKYKLINGYRENSKTIIMMTYFPIFTYILGSIVNIIYTLSFDYASAAMLSALSDKVLGIIVSILTVYLIFTIYCIVRIHAIVAKLDKVSNILFDSFMLVIHLCFVGLLWRANNAYNQLYSVVDEYFIGNPLLFVIYILLIIAVGCGIKFITITIKKDESLIYYTDGNLYENLIKQAEYNHAYNDTLDDFENYFDANSVDYEKLEFAEEVEDSSQEDYSSLENTVPEEENFLLDVDNEESMDTLVENEEIELTETEELKAVYEQKNHILSKIDDKNKALTTIRQKKSELEVKESELRVAKEAYDAALAEYNQFRLDYMNIPEVENKETNKKMKKFTPTFKKVVEYAKSFSDHQGYKVNINPKGNLLKFYIGKKMYLVLQATSSDYRISFITTPEKFVDYVTSRPGELIVPKNLKDNNWIRLTNKGKEDAKLIRQIIKQAVETAEKQIADAAAQKAAEKKAKAAERAKARAAKRAAEKVENLNQ